MNGYIRVIFEPQCVYPEEGCDGVGEAMKEIFTKGIMFEDLGDSNDGQDISHLKKIGSLKIKKSRIVDFNVGDKVQHDTGINGYNYQVLSKAIGTVVDKRLID